jgi:TonB-linked SusC/RagA family outer membrane protein
MRKHLFVTLLLTCGLPFSGQMFALANPEPQSQSQAAVTINGTVLDENNEPVIGASVTPKGSAKGAVTDVNGNFVLKVKPGTTLSVGFVGYKTELVSAKADMTVNLQPTTETLNALVVVGYGQQKKADLTGAVATVDVAKVMDNRVTGDVTKALQGAVPGLTITTNSGDINATATMRIRGLGTLSNSQTSDPLIVIDGVPTDDLSFLDPSDIAEISVLKDAASSSIYGTRAAFGVILITTKSSASKDRVSVSYTNNFAWSQATTLPQYSSVPNQIRALMQANNRAHLENELFGMYLDKMLPYAEAWEQQNGGQKAGYREMQPFQDWDNVGDYYVNANGSGAMYYADWDVTDIMYNSAAPSQKHNVSLEGSSGKTQYRASFGYEGRQGLMNFNPDQLRRYNATLNVSTEIFSWLKAGARVTFSNKEYTEPNVGRSTYTYMWRWGSYFGPYGYMLDSTGTAVDARNDIAYRKQAADDDTRCTQTRMQAWMEANPFKGFTIHADFTYDLTNLNDNYAYLPVYVWNTWGGNIANPTYAVGQSSTYAAQKNTKDDIWTMNVYGTYNFDVAKNNHFKVMVGATAEQEEYNTFTARRSVLLDNSLPYLGLTSGGDEGTTFQMSNAITHRATAGFFGRINYDYKGIYLLEFNGRYDGSSRFPANDQWAFFPSASAGYRFSEEGYFAPVKKWWSNGKLRASYGQIGNEAIGSNMFISTTGLTSTGTSYWLNSGGTKVSSGTLPSLVSSSLSWERIITTDVGLDLGFFNNALNVTADWFQRDTHDMLAPGNTLPATLGASAPYQNEGELRTRGWELGLGWNQSFGDANVYANFNIYDGKTIVTKYNNETKSLSSFYSGKEYGAIWGFETDRYFEESDFIGKDANGKWIYADGVADQTGLQSGSFVYGPGDIKFKDLNHDGKIDGGKGTADDHGDLKVIGNALPRYEYSFRLGGSFKGFDIDMFFQGVGRRHMWYTSAFVTPLARGVDATYANQESYNKMIFDENNNIIGYEIDQDNDYPCMFGGSASSGTVSGISAGCYNFYPQTKYLMNLAYLRFKTLTVGYTLPFDITKKALIQKARIYFTAENLCNLYNGMHKYYIDPEIGNSWTTNSSYSNGTYGRTAPMMRSYSFGLQVTF